MSQSVAEERQSSRARRIAVVLIVGVVVAAAVFVRTRPSRDGLLVVNPCPTDKQAAIYDHADPSADDRPVAQRVLVRGVNAVPGIDPADVTDEWSLELTQEGGRVSFRFKATGWFDDGIVTIPALSCGPSDLGG